MRSNIFQKIICIISIAILCTLSGCERFSARPAKQDKFQKDWESFLYRYTSAERNNNDIAMKDACEKFDKLNQEYSIDQPYFAKDFVCTFDSLYIDKIFVSDKLICKDKSFVYNLKNIKSVNGRKLSSLTKNNSIIFAGYIKFPNRSESCNSQIHFDSLEFDIQLIPNAIRKESDGSY